MSSVFDCWLKTSDGRWLSVELSASRVWKFVEERRKAIRKAKKSGLKRFRIDFDVTIGGETYEVSDVLVGGPAIVRISSYLQPRHWPSLGKN